jgi:riboflavin kinase/FMN adenylyltransferase
METVFSLAKIARLERPAATIGVFDGVHLGHRRVLAKTIERARRLRGDSVVITFDRHPQRVVAGSSPGSITSLEHRLHLIEREGVDCCLVLHFNRETADTPAERFAQSILVDTLSVRAVVLGYNCRFGRGGEGSAELLKKMAGSGGFEVETVDPLIIADAPVSSTRIRRLIETGDLSAAAGLLGRPYALRGTVVHGDRRGRALGFPTANLNLHHEITPPSGVYICKVHLVNESHWGLVNVGVRPTFFDDEGQVRVEVFIDGFEGGLYGETVEVEPVKYLRGEVRFATSEDLVAQMEKDLRLLDTFRRVADGDKGLDEKAAPR